MNKDFKNYDYKDCVDYCLYMKDKFKIAFESYDSNKTLFRAMYREIKNELKEDEHQAGKKANKNEVVEQYLDLLGACNEFYEPVNSKNFLKMYNDLRCAWDDLVYYIKEVRSTDI